MPEMHSTGRGGAGNIGQDDTVYTDGGIVREGVEGHEGSSGRGGAGNIVEEPKAVPASTVAGPGAGDDVIPETAMRKSAADTNYHTGRGGQGNVHHKEGEPHKPSGLEAAAEKVKAKVEHALHLDGGKKE